MLNKTNYTKHANQFDIHVKCIYLGSNKLDLEQHCKVMQTI